MFQAAGVVAIDRRPAAGVVVSFSVALLRFGIAGPLRRAVPPAVRTDKLGRWVQDGFVEGVQYVVVANAPGVTFRPEQVPLDSDHRQLRSDGTAGTFEASGIARSPASLGQTGKPPGIPGVRVVFVRVAGRADLPVPAPVMTGADGTWRQQGFQVGSSFRAVPSKAGLGFTPAGVDVTAGASSEFTGTVSVFAVVGRIRTAGGAAEPGVTIRFSRTAGTGQVPAVVVSDGAGSYQQGGFDRSSRYRVTPDKPSVTFEPPSRDVAFEANALPTLIASFERRTNLVVIGQVLTTGGAGLLSAVIRFERRAGTGPVPLPVTTTSNGEYRALGLDAGTTYRVTGSREGYGIAPAVLSASTPGTATLNLTAFPAFGISGRVLDSEGGIPADIAQLEAFIGTLPPVPGCVVAFHRTDRATPVPDPVVTAADGTFRQQTFEVGGTFVAEASAPGFVGAVLTPLFSFGIGGPFGGATSDGSSTTFRHDNSDPLGGLILLLQRA